MEPPNVNHSAEKHFFMGQSGVRIVVALVLLFCAGVALPADPLSTDTLSVESGSTGVLDPEPGIAPTTGSGSTAATPVHALQAAMNERKQALKLERERLLKMPRSELVILATRGERAAQLILAEDYADEAHGESITIVSANDAMSDAAYWYSAAARRGYPGSPDISDTLPLFPLRSVRARD